MKAQPGRVSWGWGVALAVAMEVVHGQPAGLVTLPHVDAHGRGIPGVTRPMLMAGPGMFGLGGGMAVPMTNPNWTGAAAMFAPELLMGRGMAPGMAGPMAGPALGAGAPTPGRWGRVVPAGSLQQAHVSARIAMASNPPVPSVRAASAQPRRDERSADERLLAFQQAEARKGSPGAQRALAVRYERGDGVQRSEELARAWQEAAARSEAAALAAP